MTADETKQDVVVIQADGTIDTRAAFDFEETLEKAFSANARCIVVDCSETKLLTSAGIRVLLAFAKRLKHRKGELTLMRPNQHVSTVLEISGLSSMFPSVDSAEQAVARLGKVDGEGKGKGKGGGASKISILTMRLLSGTTPDPKSAGAKPETPRTQLGSAIVGLLRTDSGDKPDSGQ